MALLRNLSIKWKLSFALILTGFTLVFAYVLIAKQTFESDKISYVYDSQGARLESIKAEVQAKLERALLSARSVIATYDFDSGRLLAGGSQMFESEKNLLALELWREETSQTVFHFEKSGVSMPPLDPSIRIHQALGKLEMKPLDNGKYVLSVRYSQEDRGNFYLRAMVDFSGILPKANTTQSLALIQNGHVLLVSDLRGIDRGVFEQIAGTMKGDLNRTEMIERGGDRFLTSTTSLNMADLSLAAVTPETEALGALGILFKRSLVFLLLSTFGLIVVSLTMARGLTSNLRILMKSVDDVGSGDFEVNPVIPSKDEMGLLARAISRMSQEIKRLLSETKEKTRMEEELKTASLVQEQLMPAQSTATVGDLEVSGLILTSSECGGDWWYYFVKGDDLYVVIADATGHGTPAALITAAARSIFSRLEREDLSLSDMMKAWDYAVASCSGGRVFMTGILFRINCQTGKGVLVTAAHERPYIFREQEDGSFEMGQIQSAPAKRIGDGLDEKTHEQEFSLAPNESIVLYTDGLFSVTKQGKALSDRRFGMKIASRAEFARSAKALTEITLQEFNAHRGDLALPDDVSIVSIRRKGPRRESILENDMGETHIVSK